VHELDGGLMLVHDRPAGQAEGLPTLDEALAFLAGTEAGVHLDLKARGAEEAVAEALRRHGLVERTVVSSFRPETLRALASAEPGVRLGLTYPEDRRGLGQRRAAAPFVGTALATMRAALPLRISRLLGVAGASAAMLHMAVVSKAAVERCHALGAPVLVWTVDEQPWVPRLDAMGVDGVISNDPNIFRD
jgi:glycerophosphoryl diester phosphodiesterase